MANQYWLPEDTDGEVVAALLADGHEVHLASREKLEALTAALPSIGKYMVGEIDLQAQRHPLCLYELCPNPVKCAMETCCLQPKQQDE